MSNQELEREIARRSTERHEREQAQAEERTAAEAEAQAQAEANRAALNDAIRTGAGSRHADLGERIFPTPPEAEPPTGKPQGSADAGEGDAGPEPRFERAPTGELMRVFTDEELNPKGPSQ